MGAPKNNETPEKPKRGAPKKEITRADVQELKRYLKQSKELDEKAEEYNKNGKRSAGMYLLYLDERTDLINKYSDLIQKIIDKIPTELKERIESTDGGITLADIIIETIQQYERERESRLTLPPLPELSSMPNGEAVNLLMQALTYSEKINALQSCTKDRRESITVTESNGNYTITRTKQGNEITIEKPKDTHKSLEKILYFIIQKANQAHFQNKIEFSIQELVDLEIYSRIDHAKNLIKNVLNQMTKISVSGRFAIGTKEYYQGLRVLFTGYDIVKNCVIVHLNKDFDFEFIAPQFTLLPRFSYALNNKAFSLMGYIFYIARQRGGDIRKNGYFTIKLDTIRERLCLPRIEEVQNSKYREKIIEPIEKAIEEIEERAKDTNEARDLNFTIEFCTNDAATIQEWLNSHIKIGLKNSFADKFIEISENKDKKKKAAEKKAAKKKAAKSTKKPNTR